MTISKSSDLEGQILLFSTFRRSSSSLGKCTRHLPLGGLSVLRTRQDPRMESSKEVDDIPARKQVEC